MEYKGSLNAVGIRSFNAPGLGERLSDLLHIASAVVIPASTRTVVTSGQTGYKPNMTYPEDLTEQIVTAFQNTVDSLAAAGVKDGFHSVYQMTTYHAGGLGDDVAEALDVATKKFFGNNRPAWAGIGVETLYGGARIEITAWAALPN
jgi:enamine deaminase RidA (YjgF/YER057c/UK114 family)